MSAEREAAIIRFVAHAGWGSARRLALAGDASVRHYERLFDGPGGASAVLMIAPPGDQSLTSFLGIARHLASLGLSAPLVHAADVPAGLLLLEDLGDALFARLVDQDPARETELYLAATDVLIALQAAPTPPAPDYGAEIMIAAVAPVHDWYVPGAAGSRDPAGRARLQAALSQAFAALAPWRPVLALRDYHAENLFWLPNRTGLARVGLIDFQDAVLTHPLYDLVSLARDVRRGVAPDTADAMHARYAETTGIGPEAHGLAAATLSAQRNLRILGIFARLALTQGKERYLGFLPRTWSLILEDLSHPALAPLREAVITSLPAPTPAIIARLKDQCGTHPIR